MLTALGKLVSNQIMNTVTNKVVESGVWFLNSVATYLKVKIRFHESRIVLYIDSDPSYLSVSKARSRVGGIFI